MIRGFRRRSLHGGDDPDAPTGSYAPPIHQPASDHFEDGGHASKGSAMDANGLSYSRSSGPTTRTLCQRAAGVSPDPVRLSVGLQAPEDITAALGRATERATP